MLLVSCFLFLLVSHHVSVAAQAVDYGRSICNHEKVSLRTLATRSFTLGAAQTCTIAYCKGNAPTPPRARACTAPGHLLVHDNFGQCTASMLTIREPLLSVADGHSRYTVASPDGSHVAEVHLKCDYSFSSMQESALEAPIPTSIQNGVTTYIMTIRARAACPVAPFFCNSSHNPPCIDPNKQCINGICIEPNCTNIALSRHVSRAPANFLAQFAVYDCHGTPLPNLTWPSFNITLNGMDLRDPRYIGEVFADVLRGDQADGDGAIPQVTTLLIDQSDSVLLFHEARIKDSARRMASRIMLHRNNYVAIIVFDGAEEPYVLQTHTTNEAAVLAAIDRLPIQTRDKQATNLHGAVVSAATVAFRMKSSFQGIDPQLIQSSLVIFTDGFDTAARVSRDFAVKESLITRENITILSIGVADSSDVDFLKAISNGYAVFATGVDALGQAFDTVSSKLEALTLNAYTALFCIPFRGKNHIPVTISLNHTTFPNSKTYSFLIDTSSFTAGCNNDSLHADIRQGDYSKVSYASLDGQTPLRRSIAARDALFFTFNLTESLDVLSVIPALADIYYQKEPGQCVFSPYCYDGIFRSELQLRNGTRGSNGGNGTEKGWVPSPGTYRAMIPNPSKLHSLHASMALRSSATTPPPLPPIVTTETRDPRPPAGDGDFIADSSGGDLDTPATIVIFLFLLLVLILILSCLLCRFSSAGQAFTSPAAGTAVVLRDGDAPLLLRGRSLDAGPGGLLTSYHQPPTVIASETPYQFNSSYQRQQMLAVPPGRSYDSLFDDLPPLPLPEPSRSASRGTSSYSRQPSPIYDRSGSIASLSGVANAPGNRGNNSSQYSWRAI